MPAGMVHTLHEIHRILKPNGTLVDLRPAPGNPAVEVELAYATLSAGEVDASRAQSDLHSANQAIQQAISEGLFKLAYDETFDYMIDLDTIDDLLEYGTNLNTYTLSEAVIEQVASLTTDEDDDFSIHIHRHMTIACYRRLV